MTGMEVLAGGALATIAPGLFKYNRENFFFDAEQRLKREYQGQAMRIKQFELYREDVRDLIGLTVAKMDNYLIIATLQLGFTVTLLTEGRPKNTPRPWLAWLYSVTTVSAFLYFLMSMWLAMHASIAAHSFGVRLLTQFVRLPVPNAKQLDAARAQAQEYEGGGIGEMLRVPVLRQQLRRLNNTMENFTQDVDNDSDMASDPGSGPQTNADVHHSPAAMLQHLRLYRHLQANWQAYDAYARVCMFMGTTQLLHALDYYCLQMLVFENAAAGPGLCAVFVFSMAMWLIVRLDLYMSRLLLISAAALIAIPPVLSVFIEVSQRWNGDHEPQAVISFADGLIPWVFLLQGLWVAFIYFLARADHVGDVALPKKFRSVLYLDVFGWLSSTSTEAGAQSAAGTGENSGENDRPAGEQQGDLQIIAEGFEDDEDSFQQQGLYARQSSGGSIVSNRSLTGRDMPSNMYSSLLDSCGRLSKELRRDFNRWDIDKKAIRKFTSGPMGITWDNSGFVLEVNPGGPAHANRVSKGDQIVKVGIEIFSNDATIKAERSGVDYEVTFLKASNLKTFLDPDNDGNDPLLTSLARMKEQYDNVVRDLIASTNMTEVEVVDEADHATTWLKLEWNTSGYPIEYFYNCATHETLWDTPPQSDTVSDLADVDRRLSEFIEKARALLDRAAMTPAQSQPNITPPRDGSVASESRGVIVHPPLARDASESSERSAVLATGEDVNPAQETQFGGRESVQLTEGSVMQTQYFAHSASAGTTFHPHHAPVENVDDQNRPGTFTGVPRIRFKPPGQMPWHIFKIGSIVLMVVWLIGFVWACSKYYFKFDIPITMPNKTHTELLGAISSATSAPAPIFEGPWPHPFMRPRGMACHDAIGPAMLVLETYAVHELRFASPDFTGEAQVRPALVDCIAAAPDFHAQGLSGISIQCETSVVTPLTAGTSSDQCTVTLLGAGGGQALRCPYQLPVEESVTANPGHLLLHGGKWRNVAVGLKQTSWAVRAKQKAIVQLGHRSGTDQELVPMLEIPYDAAGNITQLHVHQGTMLYGLESRGKLHSLPLDGSVARSMQLPVAKNWEGMCSVRDTFFFVSTAHRDAQIQVSRAILSRDSAHSGALWTPVDF